MLNILKHITDLSDIMAVDHEDGFAVLEASGNPIGCRLAKCGKCLFRNQDADCAEAMLGWLFEESGDEVS